MDCRWTSLRTAGSAHLQGGQRGETPTTRTKRKVLQGKGPPQPYNAILFEP
jgi:hypothetical protein